MAHPRLYLCIAIISKSNVPLISHPQAKFGLNPDYSG